MEHRKVGILEVREPKAARIEQWWMLPRGQGSKWILWMWQLEGLFMRTVTWWWKPDCSGQWGWKAGDPWKNNALRNQVSLFLWRLQEPQIISWGKAAKKDRSYFFSIFSFAFRLTCLEPCSFSNCLLSWLPYCSVLWRICSGHTPQSLVVLCTHPLLWEPWCKGGSDDLVLGRHRSFQPSNLMTKLNLEKVFPIPE